MDIKRNSDYRIQQYEDIKQYNLLGDNKYDYARNGILNRCLPKILFRPQGNLILVTLLQLIDARLIVLIKYIEKLQKFKWIENY